MTATAVTRLEATYSAPEVTEKDDVARERLIVVGHGMVSHRFCQLLVERGLTRDFDVVVLGEERRPAYDRVHLTDMLHGKSAAELTLGDPSWYCEHGLDLRLGSAVQSIDRKRRLIVTRSGDMLRYDRLVLATGSHANLPHTEGQDLPGVFVYRTVEDVAEIGARARARLSELGECRASVVGGGLLGLEAARALQDVGCEVAVLERAPLLLPRHLDTTASELLAAQIMALGIDLRLQAVVRRIVERDSRLVLELTEGAALESDLVVFAIGVRARDELASSAGLPCHDRGGVEVDDSLRTADPKIFAIGECARHREVAYGLVAPGYRMAEVLAAVLAGERAAFQPVIPASRLKLDPLDIAFVGESRDDGGWRRELVTEGAGSYRRLVVERNRVIGAIAVGGWDEFSRLQELVAQRGKLRFWQRARFLRSGRVWLNRAAPPIEDWPDHAVVCTCNGVTCGDLRRALCQGHSGSGALTTRTGAGSVCGTCTPLLQELCGEVESARRRPGGAALVVAGGVALAGVTAFLAIGPVALSTTVQEPTFDFLWRDSFAKQVSGFVLLGLCCASLVFSLRKRLTRFRLGAYASWRSFHAFVGVASLLMAIVHTGMRLGHNLDRMLMVAFLALAGVGALAGLVTTAESHLGPTIGPRLRRAWTYAHILAFWPLPVLVLFHVLKVYYY